MPKKNEIGLRLEAARLELTARLTMIMENIISNRGTFDPRRGKHAGPVEYWAGAS